MEEWHMVGNGGQLSPEPALQAGVGGSTRQSLRQLGFPAPRVMKGTQDAQQEEEFVDINQEEMARYAEVAAEDLGGGDTRRRMKNAAYRATRGGTYEASVDDARGTHAY